MAPSDPLLMCLPALQTGKLETAFPDSLAAWAECDFKSAKQMHLERPEFKTELNGEKAGVH